MTVLTVGIAGGTGSGKTTIAQKIANALPVGSVSILEHDSYYRNRPDLTFEERKQINFDHPDALDTELLVEHLRELKKGQAIEAPVYDFTSHARAETTEPIKPTPLVIVEGILVFQSEALRKMLDVKLFVDTEADIRVFRRIRRDIEQRGRTFHEVRERYYKDVRPMHLQFVEPSKRYADLIIPEGGNNQVALDLIVAKLAGVAVRGGFAASPGLRER